MDNHIADALKAGQFERTEEGLYVHKERTLVQGVFHVAVRGKEEEAFKNLVVDEGLDYIVGAAVGLTAGIANWYIACFTGDVSVNGATWTGANFHTVATEWTSYDEGSRRPWTNDGVASGGVDSFSNKASFTSSADAQTVRGAGMLSASAWNAGSGILLASSRFSSDKTLDTGEILDVGYGLQLSAV